jgi:hypothetical protein
VETRGSMPEDGHLGGRTDLDPDRRTGRSDITQQWPYEKLGVD